MASFHLQHIEQILLRDVRKLYFMGGIDDGVQLADLVGDALERSLPVSHTVQNTSEGPHITFGADLLNKISRRCLTYCCILGLVSDSVKSVKSNTPLSVLFLSGMTCLWWLQGAYSSEFLPVLTNDYVLHMLSHFSQLIDILKLSCSFNLFNRT